MRSESFDCPDLSLAASSYYAPIPILRLNPTGLMADYNLAAEVLLGSAVQGRRGEVADSVLAHAGAALTRLIPPSSTDGSTASNSSAWTRRKPPRQYRDKGVFDSQSFGSVEISCMAAESLDLDDGSSSGWTVYWDLHGIERHSVWEEVLTDQIRHRLAWDAYAISYDRVLLEMPYYHEVITRHIDAMKKESIETVLDIGAGTGNVTVPLLQSGRSVTAVDVSRAMLSKLRSKIRGIVSPRLKILEQNAEQMHQLDSDSYDGVSILLALYDMSYPERALAEAVRLLRPGGAIVITEPKVDFDLHVILDHCWERLRERTLERELGDDMKRVYEVNEELDPESRDSGSPMRAEIVAAWLRELNFEEVTLQESHFRQCATIRAKKPLAYTAR